MKKLFTLIFVSTLLFSCSQENEAINEENTMDFETRVNNGEFDNSKFGIYKGVFTTLDASYRGTVRIEIDGKNSPIVNLYFPDYSKLQIVSNKQFVKSQTSETLKISDNDLSFDLKVGSDGSDPVATNVIYKGKEGSIFMAKQTSKQAVEAKTGEYYCDDCSSHPELGTGKRQVFNTLLTGSGGAGSTIEIQATLGSKVYGEGSSLSVSNCRDAFQFPSPIQRCDVNGTFSARSGDVTVFAEHLYSNDASLECSTFEDGTFTYDSDLFDISTMVWYTEDPAAPGGDCI